MSFGGPRSCGSCGSTGSGPRSAARRSGARAWWPSSARRGSPGSWSRCRSRRSRRACPACPRACRSSPAGIEVRFSGAQDAVGRLFALAQALTNDYEQIRGARRGGRGGRRLGSGEAVNDDLVRVEPSDALRPARAAAGERLALPAADRRRGARGGGAVPGVLRRADRQPADAGGGTEGPWGSSWRGARRGAWRSRRSRRCTWRPTSGPTPGRRPPSSSTWRPSACSATGSAAADLPPSTCCHTFRATGITAYLSNGGTLEHAQQIAAHASPEDDETLRPDGGHDHRRRDRAHRELGGGRTARRRSPRDVRSTSRDGRAARGRVRHVGFRLVRTPTRRCFPVVAGGRLPA